MLGIILSKCTWFCYFHNVTWCACIRCRCLSAGRSPPGRGWPLSRGLGCPMTNTMSSSWFQPVPTSSKNCTGGPSWAQQSLRMSLPMKQSNASLEIQIHNIFSIISAQFPHLPIWVTAKITIFKKKKQYFLSENQLVSFHLLVKSV